MTANLPHNRIDTPTLAWALLSLALWPWQIHAQDAPDLSRWTCRFCPEVETQSRSSIELGAGFATDDLLLFAPGPGGPVRLDNDGALGWLGADWDWHRADGRYAQAQADRLGLDNPVLRLDGGHQGLYDLHLAYQELTHRPESAAQSPYQNLGAGRLALPDDWVAAGSTANMNRLSASLRPLHLEQERRWLDLGGHFIHSRRWSTALDYRHEEHQGMALRYATFLTQSSALPQDLDFVTDRIELSAQYAADFWLARLAYNGSLFRNGTPSLQWQNAYLPLSEGADQGELALAPDNQAHQLSLSGQYFGLPRLNLNGQLSAARMEQDEDLLPSTANPVLLADAALPRQSAEAQVETFNATLRANYRASRQWRLRAQARFYERNNQTPQDDFIQVRTDVFITDVRRNLPYSHRDNNVTLDSDYRLTRHFKINLGAKHQSRERRYQARRRSEENTAHAELYMKNIHGVSLSARTAVSRRDGTAFESVDEIVPPENTHQRAFNLADRQRWDTGVQVASQVHDIFHVSLQAGFMDDDYLHSELGLQSARHLRGSVNFSAALADGPLFFGYYSYARAKLRQAGSAQFSQADWWASSRDVLQGAGLGAEQVNVLPKVDLKAQYDFNTSSGHIQVNQAAFPELDTRLHSIELDSTYHWRSSLDWKLRYRYERYKDRDWQQNNIAPADLPNLLAPGQSGYNDVNHLITLSAIYRFK